MKEYMNKYNQSPKRKAENRVRSKAYHHSPEGQAKRRAYQQTSKFKAKARAKSKAYYLSPKGKAKTKAYRQTSEYKAKSKARNQTPERKAYMRKYYQRILLRKKHSDQKQ